MRYDCLAKNPNPFSLTIWVTLYLPYTPGQTKLPSVNRVVVLTQVREDFDGEVGAAGGDERREEVPAAEAHDEAGAEVGDLQEGTRLLFQPFTFGLGN